MYIVCVLNSGASPSRPGLPSLSHARCPICCDTLIPSHPVGHTHLLPQAHHVIIPALLQPPTHILSPHECAAHWLLSRVKSVRNDSHHVLLDLRVVTWQWLEPGMPQAEILSLPPPPKDLQSCCWDQALGVWSLSQPASLEGTLLWEKP